jgi:hypothetical protein
MCGSLPKIFKPLNCHLHLVRPKGRNWVIKYVEFHTQTLMLPCTSLTHSCSRAHHSPTRVLPCTSLSHTHAPVHIIQPLMLPCTSLSHTHTPVHITLPLMLPCTSLSHTHAPVHITLPHSCSRAHHSAMLQIRVERRQRERRLQNALLFPSHTLAVVLARLVTHHGKNGSKRTTSSPGSHSACNSSRTNP